MKNGLNGFQHMNLKRVLLPVLQIQTFATIGDTQLNNNYLKNLV